MNLKLRVLIRHLLSYRPRVLLSFETRAQAVHLFSSHPSARHVAAYPSCFSTPYPICTMKTMPGPRSLQPLKTGPESRRNSCESIPNGPESLENDSGPSVNDSECHTNGFESLMNGFESIPNGPELQTNGPESNMSSSESSMNESKSHMHSFEFLMNAFEPVSLFAATCPAGI